MAGAISGIAPFRNAPTCGREANPYGFAFAQKEKLPSKTVTTSHGHLNNNFLTDEKDKIQLSRRSVK
jgi:hypothetical protein